jgi:hypothetical protein
MSSVESYKSLIQTIPWPIVAAWVASTGVPYFSAYLTAHKSGVTGVLTVGLSLVAAVASALALPGNVNWKEVVGTAVVSWFIAGKWHDKVLAGTPTENWLQTHGVKAKAYVVPDEDSSLNRQNTEVNVNDDSADSEANNSEAKASAT